MLFERLVRVELIDSLSLYQEQLEDLPCRGFSNQCCDGPQGTSGRRVLF